MVNLSNVMSFMFAIAFVVINGITQIIYAQSLGYKLKPTSFAYFIGAIGNIFTGNVVPISAQAETLTMSGLIKNMNIRVASLLIAAFVGISLGIFGLVSTFVDFAGPSILYGMMAGVGLLLSETAFIMLKKRKRVGILSIATALVIWILTRNLVMTIAASVAISTLDFVFIQKQNTFLDKCEEKEESQFIFVKPIFSLSALLGGLSIICLNIGSNISFGSITSNIAGKTPNFDEITIINSLADIPSVLFGGMPLETIVSGTAATQWPVLAGIVMMTITGIIIYFGFINKIGKYVPAESISGFLFVIGFAITLLPNLRYVSNLEDSTDGFVAASITILTKNAFLGILAGILVRLIKTLWGISL